MLFLFVQRPRDTLFNCQEHVLLSCKILPFFGQFPQSWKWVSSQSEAYRTGSLFAASAESLGIGPLYPQPEDALSCLFRGPLLGFRRNQCRIGFTLQVYMGKFVYSTTLSKRATNIVTLIYDTRKKLVGQTFFDSHRLLDRAESVRKSIDEQTILSLRER